MKTFSEIIQAANSFRRYRLLVPVTYERVRRMGEKLRGLSVLHINATSDGGGVAELLRSQVALERDLGLKSSWFVIPPEPAFFQITKKIHNLLQGKAAGPLKEEEKRRYLETSREMREGFDQILRARSPNILVIHDPQPLPLIRFIPPQQATVLRLHIDLSAPEAGVLEFLRPFVQEYREIIVSSSRYRPAWLPQSKTRVIMPAIDPFTAKNQKMPLERAKRILESFSVNTDKPIAAQISRFDQWKDPVGVLKAHYIAKNEIPELQLILAGSFAGDDPEGREIFKKVKKHSSGDPDIFLWTEEDSSFINAIQTASTVIIQKSLREGFGLTMTEAMWKAKPVIAGRTEGARLQIKNGKSGILVSSPEETAEAIVRLVSDKTFAERLGKAARETVRRNFLFPRYLLDNLEVYASVLIKRSVPRRARSAVIS